MKPAKTISLISESDTFKLIDNHKAPKRGIFHKESSAFLENLINYANAPIIVWDTQYCIIRFNHAFEFLTGLKESEALGQSLEILFPEALIEASMDHIRNTMRGERWESVEIKIIHRDESVRTVLWNSATLFESDGETPIATIAQGQDITKLKETERRIQSSIIEAEEKERNRFSRDLHDGLGPILSNVKLYFQWLSETTDPEKKKLIIETGNKNINEAIETIREISNNLSPRTLNSFGLVAALQNFIDNLNITQKLFIEFTFNSKNRFDRNVEIVLFRIITELLNNTIKHSNATNSIIKLILDEEKEIISLLYRDNGIGFNLQKVQSNDKGSGLINISHRVKALNGKIRISGNEGVGVLISVELPLEKK